MNDSQGSISKTVENHNFSGFGERRYGAVNWVGLWTLYKKEVRRFLKVSFQTVLAPVISTLLFLVVFMVALGEERGEVNGVPFVVFLAPGLAMMAILNNAFANSSSSILIGKVQGTIIDYLMPPLSAAELTAGVVAGAATRGLLVGVVTTVTMACVMAFVEPMTFAHPVIALFFALSASLLLGIVGAMAGVWAEKFDQLAAITNFIITPMAFLSGTFYSVNRLPEPFLTISHWNPLFYLIDGMRYGFTGAEPDAPLIRGVILILALNAFLLYACYQVFRSGYKLKS